MVQVNNLHNICVVETPEEAKKMNEEVAAGRQQYPSLQQRVEAARVRREEQQRTPAAAVVQPRGQDLQLSFEQVQRVLSPSSLDKLRRAFQLPYFRAE